MQANNFFYFMLWGGLLLILPGLSLDPGFEDTAAGENLRIDPPVNYIAWQESSFENAAVAYSTLHDQYLVVFESSQGNGEILGRFVDGSNGDLLGPYPFGIATLSVFKAGNPDVAYDPDEDRFLVVYDEGTTTDRHIWGRLVHGSYQSSGDQLASNQLSGVSTTTQDEFDPSVAYNVDDSQYLVVFNASDTVILGQRLDSGREKAQLIGDKFQIFHGVTSSVQAPDVSWSDSETQRFLVVFSHYDSTDHIYKIRAQYIFDTEQAGNQSEYSSCLISPYNLGTAPLSNSTTKPSIAFDSLYDTFYVVFEHAEGSSRKAIYGSALSPTNDPTCAELFKSHRAFPVETRFDEGNASHTNPNIAYSGIGNIMYATYTTADTILLPSNITRIYLRIVHGEQDEYLAGDREQVQAGSDTERVLKSVCSAGRKGQALLVWQRKDPADDWDMLSRFAMPYWSWLPLLLKD